ncbi:MAG TPA: hypothetical protein PLX06_06190 [Fimbriimonadaceae bacterium]|nr:hypothetical protein [Fimbriimonadaceae bacterium]
MSCRRIRGLTLAETLVAVVFLGLCASSILSCVTITSRRMREVEQREYVLGYVRSQLESLAATSRKTKPSGLSTTASTTITGIPKAVTVDKKVTAVAGTTDLFFVDVTASWTVSSAPDEPVRTLRLTTYVRSPYG